ncbi:hypothetical protein CALVIDRAFT_60207 [Calocera viscosa TUFC12733]|uniref:Uncharacterized protein n=1 Tax=Calocera viscosa (strain TUFC12733) TaxID=1330018 RepID=A0A167NJ52_CALVF|nr:hypothetical protein CALVIDRAFT_60207 [Calocera viscosa TUFC12733]
MMAATTRRGLPLGTAIWVGIAFKLRSICLMNGCSRPPEHVYVIHNQLLYHHNRDQPTVPLSRDLSHIYRRQMASGAGRPK